jgi:hypothetical protein
MPISHSARTFYWSLPLALAAVTTYSLAIKQKSATAHPMRFVPSGEPNYDSENLERIRQDWRERNRGIGLRDVSRSGGGV